MKASMLPFTLATMLLASPASGQQPAPKPEMPPWDGAVFASTATDGAMRDHVRLVHTAIPSGSLEKWRR
jgi:hypothetical protein